MSILKVKKEMSTQMSYQYFMRTDMSPYVGEWVAIVDREIVAHSPNAKEVYEKAKKAYPRKRPLLTRIPGKETMIL